MRFILFNVGKETKKSARVKKNLGVLLHILTYLHSIIFVLSLYHLSPFAYLYVQHYFCDFSLFYLSATECRVAFECHTHLSLLAAVGVTLVGCSRCKQRFCNRIKNQ